MNVRLLVGLFAIGAGVYLAARIAGDAGQAPDVPAGGSLGPGTDLGPDTSSQGLLQTIGGDVEQVANLVSSGSSDDALTLARTIYGEARGEGVSGMQAVAAVVMNRVRAGNFPGGASVAGVCTAPWQFSCWNAGDPNRAVILAATSANPVFAQALSIANEAIAGGLTDPTGGATMYHDTSIATPAKWGNVQQTASIGRLEFFT